MRLTEETTYLKHEIFTLKGNRQQATNENSSLSGRLLASQEAAAQTKRQLDEERARSTLLADQLQGERQRTAHLETQVCSLTTRLDAQTAEMQARRHRLSLLEAQSSSALPEGVSKLLVDKKQRNP